MIASFIAIVILIVAYPLVKTAYYAIVGTSEGINKALGDNGKNVTEATSRVVTAAGSLVGSGIIALEGVALSSRSSAIAFADKAVVDSAKAKAKTQELAIVDGRDVSILSPEEIIAGASKGISFENLYDAKYKDLTDAERTAVDARIKAFKAR